MRNQQGSKCMELYFSCLYKALELLTSRLNELDSSQRSTLSEHLSHNDILDLLKSYIMCMAHDPIKHCTHMYASHCVQCILDHLLDCFHLEDLIQSTQNVDTVESSSLSLSETFLYFLSQLK